MKIAKKINCNDFHLCDCTAAISSCSERHRNKQRIPDFYFQKRKRIFQAPVHHTWSELEFGTIPFRNDKRELVTWF